MAPVRFAGGLPVEPVAEKLDFPLCYARQCYHLGRPILPAELRPLPLAERKRLVLGAINGLGTPAPEEVPAPADERFAAEVRRRRGAAGPEVPAVLSAVLAEARGAHPESAALCAAVASGALPDGAGPKQRWLRAAA